MADFGPNERYLLNLNAAVQQASDGSVVLATGTDTSVGAYVFFRPDGTVEAADKPLATEEYVDAAVLGVSTGVSQSYVDNADNAIKARVTALENTPSAAAPGAFTNFSAFGAGWSNSAGQGANPQAPAGYRKTGTDVELRGTVGGTNQGALMFILPSGFRPAYQVVIPVSGTEAFAVVKINPNGQVLFTAPNSNQTMVSLHGVRFSTLS